MKAPSIRVTPIRAVFALVVLAVALFYAYGLFIYEEPQPLVGKAAAVRWLQVDPQGLDVAEAEHPFRDAVAGAEDTWRAYVVTGGGEPRLALATARQLNQVTWSADGATVVFGFVSRPEGATGNITSSFNRILGFSAFEAATLRKAWERVVPMRANGLVSPAGNLVLMTEGRSVQSYLYVLEPAGTSRRLSGPGSYLGPASWSPDGRWILAAFANDATVDGVTTSRLYYVFSPTRDEGYQIGALGTQVRWSPDGRKIAAVRDADLLVFDIETRSSLRAEVTLPRQSSFAWSPDSRFLLLNGGVIDAATGKAVVQPGRDRIPLTSVSPDGAWVGTASDTSLCPSTPAAGSTSLGANRAAVHHVETGRMLVLVECTGALYTAQEWLTENSLLIAGNSCLTDCTLTASRVAIATLPEGALHDLTRGLEAGADFRVSPDRRRILVSGEALRVYTADGRLERTIAPPSGHLVTRVAWSPDGASFAYVVAPRLIGQALP